MKRTVDFYVFGQQFDGLIEWIWDLEQKKQNQEPLNGIIRALIDALERGDKLFYTGNLVVSAPDDNTSVQMVLDEEDFAILKSAGQE